MADKLKEGTNPMVDLEDGLRRDYQRKSHELIYESIQKSGGEPFGAPYEYGKFSLTTRIVRFFRQKSFFTFETFEEAKSRNRRNKFTRHGAARYPGEYRRPVQQSQTKPAPPKSRWQRFWSALRRKS